MDYLINLRFEGPGFVAVPNSVVDDPRVSADALSALTYLARLAANKAAVVRVSAVRRRFAWTEYKWRAIFGQLVELRCLAFEYGRASDGGGVERSLVIGWPGAVSVDDQEAVRRSVRRSPGFKVRKDGGVDDGCVIEPVTAKIAVTQTAKPGPRKPRSPDREIHGHLTAKIAVVKTDKTQTGAVPLPAHQGAKAAASATGGKVRDAREASGSPEPVRGGLVEALQGAENVSSRTGGAESALADRADRLARKDSAARIGQGVTCPDTGRRYSAADWLAKRAADLPA